MWLAGQAGKSIRCRAARGPPWKVRGDPGDESATRCPRRCGWVSHRGLEAPLSCRARLPQALRRPTRPAAHLGLLDDRQQRPLRTPTLLSERREARALRCPSAHAGVTLRHTSLVGLFVLGFAVTSPEYGVANALSTLLTVESLLFATLSLGVSLAGGTAFGRVHVLGPAALGSVAAAVIVLVALGASLRLARASPAPAGTGAQGRCCAPSACSWPSWRSQPLRC